MKKEKDEEKEEEINGNEKTIYFVPFHLKQKQRQKRKITEHIEWDNYLSGMENLSQLDLLLSFSDVRNTELEQKSFLEKQMKQKIEGYKIQDKKKKLWNPDKFIDMDTLQRKLKESLLCCFYCKEKVFIWYDYVLEPKQWTLERIFNEEGHNKDNVEIACLSCNRKRRCMFHERFRFTKQIQFIKG